MIGSPLHRKVRPPVVCSTTVENSRDCRVIHHGQRLPFGLKPCDDLFGIHPGLDHFQRDLSTDGVLLFGQPDNAHAAFAERLEQTVRTDRAVWTCAVCRAARGVHFVMCVWRLCGHRAAALYGIRDDLKICEWRLCRAGETLHRIFGEY